LPKDKLLDLITSELAVTGEEEEKKRKKKNSAKAITNFSILETQ
jgi:hypothetical protein